MLQGRSSLEGVFKFVPAFGSQTWQWKNPAYTSMTAGWGWLYHRIHSDLHQCSLLVPTCWHHRQLDLSPWRCTQCTSYISIFLECVAKGSRFTLGVWWLRCVCWTFLVCPQPFATVRNRSQPSAAVRNRWRTTAMRALWYGRAFLAKVVTFNYMEVSNTAWLFAWQAWHFVTFQHVS